MEVTFARTSILKGSNRMRRTNGLVIKIVVNH